MEEASQNFNQPPPRQNSDQILVKDRQGKFKMLEKGSFKDIELRAFEKFRQSQEKKSDLYYNPNNEKQKAAAAPKVYSDIKKRNELLVKKIIKSIGISIKSDEIKQRFKSIIITRLNDVRNDLDTREALLKPATEGGIGLGDPLAERVLYIIKKELHWVETNGMEELEKEFKQEEDSQKEDGSQKPPPPGVPPPPPKLQPAKMDPQPIFEKPVAPSPPAVPPPPAPTLAQPAIQINAMSVAGENGKPKMEDVKYRPRLIDTIEEMRRMTLVDFRRLSKDPVAACNKIKEKLDILEEESYAKRIKAVFAWRESELYQIYLEIGRIAMNQSKQVETVIEERMARNKQTLTHKEFELIMDLNSEINY